MRTFTTEEKLKCAEREVGFRKRVYERRVADGRMSRQKADDEISAMQAIADDYRQKAAGERLL